MRISTKGRHAVMAMVDLARNGQGKPIALAEIAERQDISLSYLEQLIARLKSRALVKSTRGPGGGYTLGERGDQITVAEIVSAVDDSPKRVTIQDPVSASCRQLTDLLWQSVEDQVAMFLQGVTLADVGSCAFCSADDIGEQRKSA